MALINRPLPGLFGGVSQQVPQLRDPSQCEEQINAFATLADGLNKRPGTNHVKQIVYSSGLPLKGIASHIIDQGAGNRFVVLLDGTSGGIRVFNLETGVEQTVAVSSGAGYLVTSGTPRDDFAFCTVADYTFITNKTATVGTVTTDTSNPADRRWARVISVPGANISYSIACDAGVGNYTSNATDNTATVAAALATALGTSLGGGYTVTHVGDGVISVIRGGSVAITSFSITDGWGNQAAVNLSDPITNTSALSPNGLGPPTITVQPNTVESAKYYVYWDTSTRRWVETRAPKNQVNNINSATMPHLLVRTGTTTFTFKQAGVGEIGDGYTRMVGDDDSNPVPSFVGNTITDIFFYRNRLGVLSGDAVCLTRAGKYFHWFSESARDVLDSDPIDLVAASPDVYEFNFAAPFNDQLLIFSEGAQWTLSGGDILSPKTAKLTVATKYDVSLECRPLLMGNDAYFLSALPGTSRVNRYQVADNGVSNYAGDITDHVPDYLEMQAVRMVGSPTLKMIAVINRANPGTVDVFKYEMDGAKMAQKAWGKWIFHTSVDDPFADDAFPGVVNAHFIGSKLYFLIHRNKTSVPAHNGEYTIEYMDLDDVRVPSVESGIQFAQFNVDRKDLIIGTGLYTADPDEFPGYDGYTAWTLNYFTAATNFTWTISGALPSGITSYPVAALHNTGGIFANAEFRLPGDWTGEVRVIRFGVGYPFRYRFSPFVMKDGNGIPVASSKVRARRIIVEYENSGYFLGSVTPYRRSTYTYPMAGWMVGSTAVNAYGLASGKFNIPIHTRQDGLVVELQNDLHLPTRIPYAEWEVELVQRSQR